MNKRIILSKTEVGNFSNFTTQLDESIRGRDMSLIITHIADLDGLFCALLLDKIVGDSIIIPIGNNDNVWLISTISNINKIGVNITGIFVTDIGLNDSTHEYIYSTFPESYKYYIDHHQSALAQESLLKNLYNEVIINTKQSATLNCYTNFNDPDLYDYDGLEIYVTFVNDRDLWLKQFSISDKLATLYKIFYFYRMFDIITDKEQLITDQGKIADKFNLILEIESEKIIDESKKFISYLKTIDVDGVKFGYGLYMGTNSSDISEYFRKNKPEKFNDVDVLAFIYNDSILLRLVSDSEFNVSEFAMKHGGGGHPKAAGYPLNNSDIIVSRFLSNLIL